MVHEITFVAQLNLPINESSIGLFAERLGKQLAEFIHEWDGNTAQVHRLVT